MILVPLLLGISDEETAGTFEPPHFICVEMPQVFGIFISADMELNVMKVLLLHPLGCFCRDHLAVSLISSLNWYSFPLKYSTRV